MGPSPTYHPPEGEECETSVEHGLPLWAEPAVGYCSRRPRPSPMWGSRFVGAREVGPWVGERKPLGKSPPRGNPSPESTYLPTLLCCVCGVLGHLAPVHRSARSVCCVACAVSWATWLPFTGAPAGCVVLRVRFPAPLGSCSPVRPLGVLLCVCGVLGHLAPVLRCARSVCCVACAVSWATWLLFTGVPARFVLLCLRCLGPLGSCSAVCPLGVLCCVCGVLGPLAPAHRCARSVCCVACAVSWATWLLFTGAPARCVALCARCPGPLGSCSPVCHAVVSRPFVALGARASAVSWPSSRPFTGVRAVCGARVPLVVVSLFLHP